MKFDLGSRRSFARAASISAVNGMLLASIFAAGQGFASTTAKKAKLTPLEKGLNFYRGKTVSFYSPGAPGGGFDTYSRTFAPYLSKYLGATVNVVDYPTANAIAGEDATAGAIPNGLVVGWLDTLSVAALEITNTPGLNFNPQHEEFIGATGGNLSVWVANPGACSINGWPSFLQKASASSPKFLGQATGAVTVIAELTDAAFGAKVSWVFGYATTSAEVAGFNRGDGCLTAGPLSSFGSLISAKRAVPILVERAPSVGNVLASDVAGVPTLTQELKTYSKSLKTRTEKRAITAVNNLLTTDNRILFTQSRVPADQLAALRWAMEKSMRNPGMKTQLLGEGNNLGYSNGFVAKVDFLSAITSTRPVAGILNL